MNDETSTDDVCDILLPPFYRALPEEDSFSSGLAIAFSGGIDSTVLTAALLRMGWSPESLRPVVVGTEGSRDIENASRAAGEMGLELEIVYIGPDDVLGAVVPVSRYTGTTDPVVISFTIPLYLVLVNEGPSPVMAGHGADELLGGYARYLDMSPADLHENMARDLEVLISRVERDRAMARDQGRDLKLPYLSPAFVERARALPTTLKVNDGRRKIALRKMARELGLSARLVELKKTAAQYGSGVMKVLKRERKGRGLEDVGSLVLDLLDRTI